MKTHRLLAMFSTLLIFVATSLIFAPAASAYTLTGARLPSGNFSVRISAGYPGVANAWITGINSWNASATPILISRPVAPTPPITLAETNDMTVNWDGLAIWHPNSAGITQTGTAYLNYWYTEMYTPAMTAGVAAHEIGHLIGLAHVPSGCFLMNSYTQSRCNITGPTSDEVNGARAIYK